MRLDFIFALLVGITQIYCIYQCENGLSIGQDYDLILMVKTPLMTFISFFAKKRGDAVPSPIFFSFVKLYKYLMLPINRLRQQPAALFFKGGLQQGLRVIRQCIELQPQQSQHYVNKALCQYAMGNAKIAINDLSKAITLDHLNYQAYFNIFSIQMRAEDHEGAFKNLCCCMSVLHLLHAEKEESLQEIEKAIDYSFNNKQARLFKSILKMEEKKNIQALNQINYALYLDPSHSSLKIVQEKVYKLMGMKELTAKGTQQQKPKYDRLETNKEIPSANKIKVQIDKLLKEFNKLLKAVDIDQLYKVHLTHNEVVKVNETPAEAPKIIKPKFYIAQTKAQFEESNLISDTSYKFKEEKASTTNNSQHLDLTNKQFPHQIKNEPFFLLDASFSNLSISNIEQNSNIKNCMMDYSDVNKSISEEVW